MEEFNFGENLRIVRQAKGISQEVMAFGLKIAQSTYSKIEREAKVPSPELVQEMAKQLEVEPSILLSGREIADLVPKIKFEEHAKEILKTRVGKGFFWILLLPFFSTAYDIGDGFCVGYGTTDEVRIVVRNLTTLTAIIFAYYWMRRIQKGKG